MEMNASSWASTIYLAKTKAVTHLLTYVTALSGRHFTSRNERAWKFKMLYRKKKDPVELKHCQTSSSFRIFYLMQLKPQKER